MKTRRLATLIALPLLSITLFACARVPVGEVGLKVDLYGSDRGEPQMVDPGRVWINPISQELYTFPQTEQFFEQNLVFNVNGARVTARVSGSYRIIRDEVAALFQQYRVDADTYRDTFASRSLTNCFNEQASSLQPEDLITDARNELLNQVEGCFNGRNPGYLISGLGFVDSPEFPPQIQESINNRIRAQQEIDRQQAELERQRIENQRELEQAQTDAEIARLQAQSATEESIELQRLRLQQQAIEKWDGVMPQVVGGDGALPFIEIQ